ncbi:MAG: hypothetical protein CMJ36_00895 [Phycisphaerae bacterium]|nr:hypothetical protein [Phycisphaerae bacterium]
MGSKRRKQEEVVQEVPAPTWPWFVGLLGLLLAIAASSVLVLKQLDLLGASLPGCGPQSACDKVTNTAWGRVPGLGWPVSYVGFSYFLAMLFAWFGAREHVSGWIRWISRIGALASFLFIIAMISLEALCPYCLIAHVGNLGFWIAIELGPSSSADHARRGLVPAAAAFLLSSGVVGIVQMQQDDARRIKGEAIEEQQIQEMAEAAIKAAEEGETDPTGDGPGDEPVEGDSGVSSSAELFTGRYLLGSEDAPIKLVMISDYQCPDCYTYENQAMSLVKGRDDLSLSVKHFPFCTDCNRHMPSNKHPNACRAAWAAEAAGILGGNDAFWEMHSWLFEQKGRFNQNTLNAKARELGLDPLEFNSVMRSDAVKSMVEMDIEEAKDLGIFFTPMIFVNGIELKWYSIPSSLTSAVNKIAAAIRSGEDDGSLQAPPMAEEKYLLDWQGNRQVIFPSDDHVPLEGDVDHPVTAMVWVEYNSDFLPKMEAELNRLRENHPGIRIGYRVYPVNNICNKRVAASINRFPWGCMTAKAAKAAYIVGGEDGWRVYHEWLLENGSGIRGERSLVDGAAEVGLDATLFQEALNGPEAEAMVAQDVRLGGQVRFRGPPAICINGRHVPRYTLEGHDILGTIVEAASRGQ